jgi:hypothetical protein
MITGGLLTGGPGGTPDRTTEGYVPYKSDKEFVNSPILTNGLEVDIGGPVDRSTIEEDGTLVFKGEATVWDEASRSFIGSNIFIVAGRVDYNFTELTLDFETNARYPEEPVGVVIQALHARKAESDIRPHIHWMQTSNANPNILIEYRWINNGGVPTAWTLKALTAADNAFPYTAGAQQITEFNLPAGHGVGKELSVTFDCKIYRDSLNTSGSGAGRSLLNDNYRRHANWWGGAKG